MVRMLDGADNGLEDWKGYLGTSRNGTQSMAKIAGRKAREVSRDAFGPTTRGGEVTNGALGKLMKEVTHVS